MYNLSIFLYFLFFFLFNWLFSLLFSLTSLLLSDVGANKPLGPHSEKRLKSLKLYQGQAVRAWNYFKINHSESVDFSLIHQMLNYLDNFLPLTQAIRLFNVFDMKREGLISLLDFENLLIAKELLTPLTNGIILLDTFDALKSDNLSDLSKKISEKIIEENENNEEKNSLSSHTVSSLSLSELKKINMTETARLDYSGYIEAVDFLGHKKFDLGVKEDQIRESFNSSKKEGSSENLEENSLTIDQFRKSWLKIAGKK